jgi:target of EGR1 protein 1
VDVYFSCYQSVAEHVAYRGCGPPPTPAADGINPATLCESFMHHGHCPKGASCSQSHDVDRVVDYKEGRVRKRKKMSENSAVGAKKASSSPEDNNGVEDTHSTSSESNPNDALSGGHRAGFDAFMTGYVLAHHRLKRRNEPSDAAMNKLYLVGKDFPLLLRKSAFAKNSAGHFAKLEKVKQQWAKEEEDTDT